MNIYVFVVNNFILPFGNRLFSKGNYLKVLKEWKKFDSLTSLELHKVQEKKLIEILKHTNNTVEFYKKSNLNIDYNSNIYEELKKFPILTKEILRKDVENLISNNYKIEKLEKNHSSGSTGVQSFTYMTIEHKFMLRAMQSNWFSWSGYQPGNKLLQFGMSSDRILPKKLKDIFFRVYYVTSFYLSKFDLYKIAKNTFTKKIKFIAGYPSEINEIALSIIKNNFNYNATGIVTFGDKLFEHHKKNYQLAFGKNITMIDTYGCAEGLLMACKKDLEYYYIMSPHVNIEILDDNGSEVEHGDLGHVVVTCLTNYAMPIIRYKLGDMAIKLPLKSYPKESEHQYPLLQKIIGRSTDYVESKDGVKLFVTTFVAIVEFYPEIKQFKIIQEDIEILTFQYLLDDVYKTDILISLKKIEEEICLLTQNKFKINFQEVNIISPSSSGKPKIIESKIMKEKFI